MRTHSMWPKDIIFSFWHDYLQQFFLKNKYCRIHKVNFLTLIRMTLKKFRMNSMWPKDIIFSFWHGYLQQLFWINKNCRIHKIYLRVFGCYLEAVSFQRVEKFQNCTWQLYHCRRWCKIFFANFHGWFVMIKLENVKCAQLLQC